MSNHFGAQGIFNAAGGAGAFPVAATVATLCTLFAPFALRLARRRRRSNLPVDKKAAAPQARGVAARAVAFSLWLVLGLLVGLVLGSSDLLGSMGKMFDYAYAFNQPLASWDTSAVTSRFVMNAPNESVRTGGGAPEGSQPPEGRAPQGTHTAHTQTTRSISVSSLYGLSEAERWYATKLWSQLERAVPPRLLLKLRGISKGGPAVVCAERRGEFNEQALVYLSNKKKSTRADVTKSSSPRCFTTKPQK